MRIEQALREERLREGLRDCRFGADLRVLGVCDDPDSLLDRLFARGSAGDGTVFLLDESQASCLRGALILAPPPDTPTLIEAAGRASERAFKDADSRGPAAAGRSGAPGIETRLLPSSRVAVILRFEATCDWGDHDSSPPATPLAALSTREQFASSFLRALDEELRRTGRPRNGDGEA